MKKLMYVVLIVTLISSYALANDKAFLSYQNNSFEVVIEDDTLELEPIIVTQSNDPGLPGDEPN